MSAVAARGFAALIGIFALLMLGIGLAIYGWGWILGRNSGDWSILAYFMVGGLFVLIAIVSGGIALILAALGVGTLPRWASALGALFFVALAIFAALGLTYSGTPVPVLIGMALALAGAGAGVRAWRRGG